ncbi:serine/threonine-protein kinase [Kitasatospora aureofaciens]|uniref:serine/threonine-protein kinase n=1 Tax=Kitasatospora aureofaciens TaxID=1894 RepID=UPI00382D730A
MRGTTLGDRYRLDEWLGGGSMGDVWLAEDEVLGRRVAVKVLKPALLDEPGFAERFHEEARVMARLRHPGIVGVHDFGSGRTDGGRSWTTAWGSTGRPIAYLVMELIDGEPLSDVLKRRGRLTAPKTLGLALQVLAALRAAHEAGVVHRDIKPDNLMVRDERVVIADVGIARPLATPAPGRRVLPVQRRHPVHEGPGPGGDALPGAAVALTALRLEPDLVVRAGGRGLSDRHHQGPGALPVRRGPHHARRHPVLLRHPRPDLDGHRCLTDRWNSVT